MCCFRARQVFSTRVRLGVLQRIAGMAKGLLLYYLHHKGDKRVLFILQRVQAAAYTSSYLQVGCMGDLLFFGSVTARMNERFDRWPLRRACAVKLYSCTCPRALNSLLRLDGT